MLLERVVEDIVWSTWRHVAERRLSSLWRWHAFGITPRMEHNVDGDTSSLNSIVSDEALKEVKQYLNTWAAYVDPRGGLKASANVATVALVMRNMTG